MEDLIDVNIIFISICLAIFYKYIITIWAGLLLWKYYIFGTRF